MGLEIMEFIVMGLSYCIFFRQPGRMASFCHAVTSIERPWVFEIDGEYSVAGEAERRLSAVGAAATVGSKITKRSVEVGGASWLNDH